MRLTVPGPKWLCVLLAVANLPSAWAGAPPNAGDAVVKYYCAGLSQLANDPHLPTLHKILTSPSSTNLQNLAMTRLSGLLAHGLRLGNNPAAVSLIEPLLNDVMTRESLGCLGDVSTEAPAFFLALHLESTRVQLWQDNLSKIFGGSGEKFTKQEFNGRRWNMGGSNSIWIIPARDWLVVGRDDDFSESQMEYLNNIKAKGRPGPALEHDWFEADLTSAHLGGWFQLLQPAHIRITATPNDDNLQISARILSTEAIPWKTEPWQIPKDLMRGSIISFTAGQNVAAFLKMNPTLAHLPGNPLTNQFFCWALDQMPLLNYMAWPEANASNTLEKLSTEAPALLNSELKRFDGAELLWQPQGKALMLRNIRLFVPNLQAVQGIDGQFLFLSSFPRSLQAAPVPDRLLGQIDGHTNLVYYDWELTGRRLQEWQMLSKMIANRALAQNGHAGDDSFIEHEWLVGLGALTGNTVTEIKRVAPNELSVTRKGPMGLTAVELVLLADWACDANSGPIHSPQPLSPAIPLPGR